MAGPIDSLECRSLNGVEQWLLIQSRDAALPLLLILHGGPGYAMLPLFHACNGALEDHFVLVNWDQRGAGRSYNSRIPRSSMTLRQFLDDLEELTRYLKTRFGREQIYLLGHSFGTMLGLLAVKEHPEHYQAYIGVGQVVGPIVNEIAMYEWTLATAEQAGHAKAVRALRRIGHPDAEGKYPGGADGYDVAESWMAFFGGDLYQKQGTQEIDDWLLSQPVYQGRWRRKWEAGLRFSSRIWQDPAAWQLDFRRSVTAVEVPVVFLQGRHDRDTPSPLVADYVPLIQAPRKELIWFEQSAHFPFYEERELFNRTLVQTVKAQWLP